MELSDYILLPGVVASINDEEHLGRIKVSLPNSQNPTNCKVEAMPWVYPLTMTGTYQGFTNLVVGQKVWVMKNKTNEYEMWYWPLFELNPNTKDIIAGYDNCDVLVSRDMGGANVYIYYTDGKGIVLSVGDTKINVAADGSIILNDAGNGKIKIKSGNIYLNTESEDAQAVNGTTLKSALDNFAGAMKNLATSIEQNGYVSTLGEPLKVASTELQNGLSQILCENIFVS